MSLSVDERAAIVALEFEKALKCLSEAEYVYKMELWGIVANRLYYSASHAVYALLIHDHHNVGTHRGTVAAFGMYYIKTCIINPKYGRFYSRLQSLREAAAYNVTWAANKSDIEEPMPMVRSLLNDIRLLISDARGMA